LGHGPLKKEKEANKKWIKKKKLSRKEKKNLSKHPTLLKENIDKGASKYSFLSKK